MWHAAIAIYVYIAIKNLPNVLEVPIPITRSSITVTIILSKQSHSYVCAFQQLIISIVEQLNVNNDVDVSSTVYCSSCF